MTATDQAGEVREGCVGTMDAARATYFLERFKREEKWLGPHEQWALDFTIAALATQPATGRTMGGEAEKLIELCDAACSNAETALNFLGEAGRPGLADTQRSYIANIRAEIAALQNGGER